MSFVKEMQRLTRIQNEAGSSLWISPEWGPFHYWLERMKLTELKKWNYIKTTPIFTWKFGVMDELLHIRDGLVETFQIRTTSGMW